MERRQESGQVICALNSWKIQTAERQVETDGHSCGREGRKCQNSVREEIEVVVRHVERIHSNEGKNLAVVSYLSVQRCTKAQRKMKVNQMNCFLPK